MCLNGPYLWFYFLKLFSLFLQSEISSQLEEKSVEEKSALEQSIVLSETTPFYMPKDLQVCTRKLLAVFVSWYQRKTNHWPILTKEFIDLYLMRVNINCRQSKWTPKKREKSSFEIWRATLSLVSSTVKSSSKPELNRWSQFSEQKLRFFFKSENF